MKLGLVGCGFVADQYIATLDAHPHLSLEGVYDRNAERARAFAECHGQRCYESLEALLADDIDLVLNLTNPRSHAEVTSRALMAGKHVYSEKPLAMSMADADRLLDLAEKNHRTIAVAPCSALSPAAQTLWKALKDDAIGTVRVVYANFDDGMIAPNQKPWGWQ